MLIWPLAVFTRIFFFWIFDVRNLVYYHDTKKADLFFKWRETWSTQDPFFPVYPFTPPLFKVPFGFQPVPALSIKKETTLLGMCVVWPYPVVHTQRHQSHVSTFTVHSAEVQIQIVPKCRETCSKAIALKPSEGANSWLKYLLGITSDFLLHRQVSKGWFLKYQRTQQVTILWPLRDKNETEYREYLH